MNDEFNTTSQQVGELDALRRKVTELTELLQQKTTALESLERRVEHRTKELEKAIDELRVSEANYREIFDAATDMIVVQHIETGEVIDVNHETTRVTGYTFDELCDRGVQSFGPEGPGFEPERAMAYIAKAAAGEPQLFEWGFVTKDGEFHPTEVHLKRVTIGGEPRLLGVARDITKRKQAEEERDQLERQVRQAQKLESLGVLAGGIAHDFNNLLAGIMGNAGLALIKLPPDSMCRGYMENIETTAKRAAELTNQMLAYSGKGGFIVQPLIMSRLVEEMGHLLEVVVSKKASLEYGFAADLPQVECDASQIRQVLMNLITNASDAIGDESGVISVRTGLVEADSAYLANTFMDWDLPGGPYVFVEVSDTGCGMPEDTQKKIFDPFFTTKFTGRGLGLAATLGIIRGHKGAINVESKVGEGTTIRVLLPAVSNSPEVNVVGPVTSDNWYGSGLVLVVDDEDFVREMAKEVLETIGFDVVVAEDGFEAVGMFKELRDEIRAVVLDMTMPRMNGEETFSELRRIRSDVPVLLSSGYSEHEAQTRFAGKGLSGFIQKPYTPQRLAGIMHRILRD